MPGKLAAKAAAKGDGDGDGKNMKKKTTTVVKALLKVLLLFFFTRHPFSANGGSNISLNQDTNIIIT